MQDDLRRQPWDMLAWYGRGLRDEPSPALSTLRLTLLR